MTEELTTQLPVPSQLKEALCKHFLDHHPAPSWEKVAYAVYNQAFYDNCYGILEVIQSSYLKGKRIIIIIVWYK